MNTNNNKKILLVLIIILLGSNIYLLHNFNEVNKKEELRKICLQARADTAIGNTVQHISQLIYKWDDIKDVQKMQYLANAEGEISIALELQVASDNFFQPMKVYKEAILEMENKILKQVNLDIQKDYIEGLQNDLFILSEFSANNLVNNRVSEISFEEIIEHWKSVATNLKTKEIYEYSKQL